MTRITLQCTLYYEYHDGWRDEWSLGGEVVLEQQEFDGLVMIIKHDQKLVIVQDQGLEQYNIPLPQGYTIEINPEVADLLLYSDRPCDCLSCQQQEDFCEEPGCTCGGYRLGD